MSIYSDISGGGAILPGNPPQLCPELLTEEEAVRYLRLDTINGIEHPADTLARYRAGGSLRGTQVSKRIFYRRLELDRFLDRLTEQNPR
jgi:hypothetical protein